MSQFRPIKYLINGAGKFWAGIHSTTRIENTWANIKNTIKNIYNITPNSKFINIILEMRIQN